MSPPLVSVCIVTYQHAAFVARAIEGALMQKTDFPFEILIGEDESTDGTREICLDYARRFPGRIKVFLRSRSDVVHIDGRPRGSFNFRMTVREAKGEFVALCEGDDHWTDPEKLQRQVDYLNANADCVGSFHDVTLVDRDGVLLQESYFASDRDKFSQKDVLGILLSRQPTCAMVFRKHAFSEPLPEWYLRRPCDLYLDLLLTARGQLGYLRRNMGVYRKHPGGIWSGQREANQIVELIIRYKLLLADPFFFENYRELLLRKVDEFQSTLFTRDDLGAEIRRLEAVVSEQTEALGTIERSGNVSQQHIDELKTQLDRLAATSLEQKGLITSLQNEHARLVAETEVAQNETGRVTREAQGHIDALKAQLDRLAAASLEQNTLITSLQGERDRLTAEAEAARNEAGRVTREAQRHIDDLKAALDRLAATSLQQAGYVSVLEKERDRLTGVEAELRDTCDYHMKTIAAQTARIQAFERQHGTAPGT